MSTGKGSEFTGMNLYTGGSIQEVSEILLINLYLVLAYMYVSEECEGTNIEFVKCVCA